MLPKYDDNLPSTSTRSPSFSIPLELASDICLENISSSSSSNSVSSTGNDAFQLPCTRAALNSKRWNLSSELYGNESNSSSPINSGFDALALKLL